MEIISDEVSHRKQVIHGHNCYKLDFFVTEVPLSQSHIYQNHTYEHWTISTAYY